MKNKREKKEEMGRKKIKERNEGWKGRGKQNRKRKKKCWKKNVKNVLSSV